MNKSGKFLSVSLLSIVILWGCDYNTLKNRVEILEEENAQLEEKITKLEEEKKELEDKLSKAQEEMDDIDSAVNEVESSIDQLLFEIIWIDYEDCASSIIDIQDNANDAETGLGDIKSKLFDLERTLIF